MERRRKGGNGRKKEEKGWEEKGKKKEGRRGRETRRDMMEESQKGQREARREMVDGAREGERREGAVLCSTVRREPVSRSLLNQMPRRRVCIGWAGRRRQYCIKTYCRSARRLQSFFYSPLYFKFVPSLRTDASRHLPARTNHSNSNNSFILSSASPGST